jgi:ADP-ribosylglycohydrolase
MLGAIAGDVIGSVHEGARTKTKDFPLLTPKSRFTDDTVLIVAVADCLLRGRGYVDAFHDYFHAYPHAGYGGTFWLWASSRRRTPYQSWGNGSAMRVSPVAFAGTTLDGVLAEAKRSAAVTHDHAEGIRGAQAVAAAIFLARTGATKEQIRQYVVEQFDYFLDELWTNSVPRTNSMRHANGRCRRRSSPSWNRPGTRTQSATPFPSAVMPTRWRASLARSQRHSTEECQLRSPSRCSRGWTIGSATWSSSFRSGSALAE